MRRFHSASLAALAALAALALAMAAQAASAPDAREIRLRAGAFDPLTPGRPSSHLPDRAAYPSGALGAYLVQFEQPIDDAMRSAVEALGVKLGGSVPVQALEALMTEAQRAQVSELPGVRWVGPYQASWKLSPGLLASTAGAPTAMLRVSLFAGAGETGLVQLRALGATLGPVVTARSFSYVDVEIPAAQVAALADLPLVRFVQRVPVRVPLMDRVRDISGLDAIADATFASGLDPSLDGRDDGSGFQVKYGHTDGGLWTPHPAFQASQLAGWMTWEPGADTADASGHGTHTAGILVGDGTDSDMLPAVPPGTPALAANLFRGVQPEAALHHVSDDNVVVERDVFELQSRAGAQILSNSWGYATCPTCGIITDYDTIAALWDEGVWDADEDLAGRQPVTVFFAAGNSGFELLDGCPLLGGPDRVSSPGTAKNVITIGASETDRGCGFGESSAAGDVLFVSSRGPTDPDGTGQGLFKPDLVAVGGGTVLSAERDGTGGAASASGFDDPTWCSDSGPDYRYEGGTSMACPAAAGAGGVLYQDLVVNHGVSEPSPSLIKAMLINGAVAIEPTGGCGYTFETDATQVHRGWGRVKADDALYGATGSPALRDVAFENEVTDDALATAETHQVMVPVTAGETFKVTLVWTDYPASPGAGSPLVVNDLDLEVSGPEGVFLGNNFVNDWSAVRVDPPDPPAHDVPDRYNVVENVYIQSPAGGTYTISVHGFQVSQDQEPDKGGTNQDFSLVWSTASIDAVPVPEPSGSAMLLAGCILLHGLARRRPR